jgi:hypothetical protein
MRNLHYALTRRANMPGILRARVPRQKKSLAQPYILTIAGKQGQSAISIPARFPQSPPSAASEAFTSS